jgi:hypothetical protein
MKNKVLLDKKAVERTINRIAHEIIEKNKGVEELRLIGIRTRGVYLAQRIKQKIDDIEHISLPIGVLDITMYRDDVFKLKSPELKKTEIPFDVNNITAILLMTLCRQDELRGQQLMQSWILADQREFSLLCSLIEETGSSPYTLTMPVLFIQPILKKM